ncbi:ABC-F family ATP-binding cassette domain-containing protein [Dermabacteraceae bacterium TAE3-ERU27]|nr:ABC-F family ATP-binding cassette domain-containing protein [Dermabacteraceae bacterium TAE3-ERU27]
MAHLLGAHEVHLAHPNRVLLDSVTLGVNEGDRIGVVGRNGDGKSTLLRILAGVQQPDSGRVTVRGGVRVGMLRQEDTAEPSVSIKRAVVGDVPDHVWASNPLVRDVLEGLLGDLDLEAELASLSGGQLRRVHLAALLAGDDDVLFLDEPTNHLDMEGIAWLAAHLKKRWPANAGGLVVVTHDRWFLDEVCTDTWEVHDGIVEPFEGGYAAYVLQRVERDRQAAASEAKRQNLMRKELAWLRRGAPARTSKPKFRIDAANALIANEPPVRDTVELTKLATSRLGRDVVDFKAVSKSYDRPVLQDVEISIGPGQRIGILGQNGAGKSTFLKLVTGEEQPTEGRVKRGKTVQISSLSQRLEGLEPYLGRKLRDVIADYRTSYSAGKDELTPGQLLERLGFTSAHLSAPVAELSGGQKRRLELLLTLLDEPNVLILDEPTNDMDTDMLAAVEDLLDTWPGTLLVVSHDRYLTERVTDDQYAVIDGRLRHLPGGVDEYLRLRAKQDEAAQVKPAAATSAAGDPGGLSGAQRRNAEKELSAAERRMEKLSAQIEKANTAMADIDPSDFTALQQAAAKVREMEDEVASLEERWLELSEQLG